MGMLLQLYVQNLTFEIPETDRLYTEHPLCLFRYTPNQLSQGDVIYFTTSDAVEISGVWFDDHSGTVRGGGYFDAEHLRSAEELNLVFENWTTNPSGEPR